MNEFVKIHGLGNEYIVLDSDKINFELTAACIKTICNVHFGIGSDGILLKVPAKDADFGLRIFNPDGSEAEKSGNGLRIFSKFIFDSGYAKGRDFSINTLGGIVWAHIIETKNNKAVLIKVDMGKPIFSAREIPVNADGELFFDKKIQVADREYVVNCVSVGNPHCVIIKDNLDIEEIKKYGPLIEVHPMFPNKINVQFVKPVSDSEIEMLIWERGAGYTLASGSSSSAVSCVIRKKGLVGNNVMVKMPGGNLQIEIDDQWNIRMTGPVVEVCTGVLSSEMLNE
jgi:diaminopimelate epimerase